MLHEFLIKVLRCNIEFLHEQTLRKQMFSLCKSKSVICKLIWAIVKPQNLDDLQEFFKIPWRRSSGQCATYALGWHYPASHFWIPKSLPGFSSLHTFATWWQNLRAVFYCKSRSTSWIQSQGIYWNSKCYIDFESCLVPVPAQSVIGCSRVGSISILDLRPRILTEKNIFHSKICLSIQNLWNTERTPPSFCQLPVAYMQFKLDDAASMNVDLILLWCWVLSFNPESLKYWKHTPSFCQLPVAYMQFKLDDTANVNLNLILLWYWAQINIKTIKLKKDSWVLSTVSKDLHCPTDSFI